MFGAHWYEINDGDPRGRAHYVRHYSSTPAARRLRDARGNAARFVGPGEKMLLLTVDGSALFAWRKERFRLDDQRGVNGSIFRNEGPIRSSDLIREACELAWQRWPGERLFTFVDAGAVRSTNPGCCFLKAGWRRLRQRSKNHGLRILEILPQAMARAV